ncbi:MAG: hypothetical protein H7196_04535 [candidate division SR1 bacterium]|nr:hypothetical protein [candidate division SR1 bacterium]
MSKNNLNIFISLVIIIIIVGVIALFVTKNKKDNNKSVSDSEIISDTKKSQDETNVKKLSISGSIADIAGLYKGRASLITQSLVFPTSTLKVDSTGAMTLNSKGLSLAALANAALKINNIYPSVNLAISGKATLADTKTLKISIESIAPSLVIDNNGVETPVDAETSFKLFQAISTAGITIPQATAEQPILLSTNLENNPGTNIIKISTLPNQPVFALFEGAK